MRKASGLTLIEVLVALLVIGLAVGALMGAAGQSSRALVEGRDRVKVRALAEEIYEEIVSLPRGSDRASAASRRSDFVSPLDYDGLDESPPRDPLEEALPGAAAYGRRVGVRWVDERNPEREVGEGQSGLLRVTVEILRSGDVVEKLTFFRSLR